MNHIAKLTECFLIKEQDNSLNLLISHNILFNFMLYLDFPLVRNFFLFAIGNLYHHSYLTIKNQIRLWKYLSGSSFFIDFANLMLIPDKFDLSKTRDSFQPYDKSLFMVAKDSKFEYSNDFHKGDESENFISLFEEYNGFRTDIDRVKSVIHGKKTYLLTKVVKQVSMYNKLKSVDADSKGRDLSKQTGETRTNNLASEKSSETIIDKNFLETKFLIKKQSSIRISEWKKKQSPELLQSSPKNIKDLQSPTHKTEIKKFFLQDKISNKRKSKGKSMTCMSDIKNHLEISRETSKFTIHHNLGKSLLPQLNSKINSISKKSYISMDFKNSENNKILPSINEKKNLKKGYLRKVINVNEKHKGIELSLAKQQPYITEVIEYSKVKINLKELYPNSLIHLKENDVDRKAKDLNFSLQIIKENDYYALHIAEILSLIIKNAIENYTNIDLKKKIEYVQKDYSFLFEALFSPENGKFTEILFEVYIKLYN